VTAVLLEFLRQQFTFPRYCFRPTTFDCYLSRRCCRQKISSLLFPADRSRAAAAARSPIIGYQTPTVLVLPEQAALLLLLLRPRDVMNSDKPRRLPPFVDVALSSSVSACLSVRQSACPWALLAIQIAVFVRRNRGAPVAQFNHAAVRCSATGGNCSDGTQVRCTCL